jgi:hypothetical protein
VDEADTIEPDLAHKMWKLLISRLRVRAPYVQGFTTSTPEGFGFMYDYFVKDVREKPELSRSRRIIHARTYDNPFLEPEFINSLLESYPQNLIEAYLNGQFVNLNNSGVYPGFTDDNIISGDIDIKDKVLHIGVDFNVENMNAVVFIREGVNIVAIDEIQLKHDTANTYSMADVIKAKYPNNKVLLYPDATGRNRTANTVDINNTNHAILRKAGFKLIFSDAGNPPIEDRTVLINSKILSGNGKITFRVHERCTNLIHSLKQRQYKNGIPEKDNITDHGCDCMDYVIWHLYSKVNTVRQYNLHNTRKRRDILQNHA